MVRVRFRTATQGSIRARALDPHEPDGRRTLSRSRLSFRQLAYHADHALTDLRRGAARALCSRLRVGKLGIDGLPFYSTVEVQVVLSPLDVTVRTREGHAASVPAPDGLGHRAQVVRLAARERTLSVELASEPAAAEVPWPNTPAYVLFSRNSGAPDPRGRFGEVTLRAHASPHSTPPHKRYIYE
jgi:hypothetical protein